MDFSLFCGLLLAGGGVTGLLYNAVNFLFPDAGARAYRRNKDVATVRWHNALVNGSIVEEKGDNVLVKLWFGREPEVWFCAGEILSRRVFFPPVPEEQNDYWI